MVFTVTPFCVGFLRGEVHYCGKTRSLCYNKPCVATEMDVHGLPIFVLVLITSFRRVSTQSTDNFLLPALMNKLGDLETTLEVQCQALKEPSSWPVTMIDIQEAQKDIIDVRKETGELKGKMNTLQNIMQENVDVQNNKIASMQEKLETGIAFVERKLNNYESKLENAVKSIQNQIDDNNSKLSTVKESVTSLRDQVSRLREMFMEAAQSWPTSITERGDFWQPTTKSPSERGYTCNDDGWCLKNNKEKKTWEGAKRACEQDGAILAIIRSRENQAFIDKLISDNKFTWIGLKQYGKEEYRWEDGTALGDYRPWGKSREEGDRDKYDHEDCIYIYNGGSRWGDFSCQGRAPYICQITTGC